MLETIYISRHGYRSNWIPGANSASVTGMTRDPPLASYGLEQSEDLAKFLSSPPSSESLPIPQLIFSSPFYRCIQTASFLAKKLKIPIRCEHGVMEWYSTAKPNTGLHPRPSPPSTLQQFFEPDLLEQGYSSTVYPSRRGETLAQLQARCDLFVTAFAKRVEVEYPEVKTVSIYGHAASVIALGRALTGERKKNVPAGCASTSMYVRRRSGDEFASSLGGWECKWSGRTDYLPNGEERNWSFNDVTLTDDGEVIEDNGDMVPHSPEDEVPTGLAPGMEKYVQGSGSVASSKM